MSDMGHQGGHGGHMHPGQGGDGAGFSQAMGVAHGHHHHGFLAHLLGLDHDAHGHHHHGHATHQGVPIDGNPQGSPSWSSPLQAIKLADLFQGINVTPNVMFLVLFIGFAAWLGVIYWVRHHEPMANQVLGNTGGYSTTAAEDRRLVAGMRYAVPIRTSASTGSVYVPNTGDSHSLGQNAGAYAAPVLGQPPVDVAAPQSAGNAAMQYQIPAAPPSMTAIPMLQSSVPAANGTPGSAYFVPVRTADGLRVKTITNR